MMRSLIILLAAVSCAFAQPPSGTDRPNILLVLIDDMGWKDISCAGSTYHETPHIDRLAAQGLRFVNAYSAAPVCTPSRGAIFSGKAPARTKLTTVFSGQQGPDDRLFNKSKYRGEGDQYLEALHRHALPAAEYIIPQALSAAGYKTGFFGKWHIGECENYHPIDRGFDVAKGYRMGPSTSNVHWMKNFAKFGAGLDPDDKEGYVSDVLTKLCSDFITENKEGPWMAVLSHYLVHGPIEPKPEKLERYKDKPTTDQNNPGFASMVESVDESVGRLMQTLESLNLDDNTLVIFTSDNGGPSGKFTSPYPLRGGKSFPFEGGMAVPFIVRWPAQVKPGVSEEKIIGMDLYPTMLSAAGVPLLEEQHVDGVDLMPVLTKGEKLKERSLVFHFPHYTHATGPFSSIIKGGWKLIRFYNNEDGAFSLYNLNGDREEQHDLAGSNPEKVQELVKSLNASLTAMDAEMPILNTDRDLNSTKRPFTLKSTKGLADHERVMFEKRLNLR